MSWWRPLPRARALPQIFVDGTSFGSFEDLRVLAAGGRLQPTCSAD